MGAAVSHTYIESLRHIILLSFTRTQSTQAISVTFNLPPWIWQPDSLALSHIKKLTGRGPNAEFGTSGAHMSTHHEHLQ